MAPPALPFVDLPDGSVGYSPGPQGSGGSPLNAGRSVVNDTSTSVVGTGDLTADHNTPLHVGGLILLGLGITILLRFAGFRFAVDAGVGR